MEKIRNDRDKADPDRLKLKAKHSSKEIKREKERDNLKGLNLILVEMKSGQSPDR
jgi:hypothetical protein